MKTLDLLRLIFGNLNRRKGRVALTAIGVVIGTAAVVVLVSLAIGLQRSANEQLYGIGDLTQIQVMPAYGMEGGPVMVSGGGGISEGSGGPQAPKLLTNSALKELTSIPGVVAAIPRDYMMGNMMMKYKRLEGGANVIGIGINSLSDLGMEAVQGNTDLTRGSIIIGPQVAVNFYDPRLRPGQEPPPPSDLYGETLTFVIFRYDDQGNETRKTVSFRVAGMLTETLGESDWSVFMRLDELKALNEWAMNRRINYNKDGYNQVVVKVDHIDNVLTVNDQINEMGFQAFTPQSFVQGINNFYLILQVIFGGVGAIALLVAAIGIGINSLSDLGMEAVQGSTDLTRGSIIIGPQVAVNFYDPRLRPGQEPPPPPDLYGETLTFVVFRYDDQGNETRKTVSFRVAGMLTETLGESDWSVFMRLDELKALNEWAMNRRINYNKDGYNQVVVKVDNIDNVLTVNDQINEMGFQAFTPQSFVQ
ncbi:MAG TPA: ABC transporter permease, partial [Anaerolineales bacterium]|nr:ABC transporter permease [Anaerolineales bacterium]